MLVCGSPLACNLQARVAMRRDIRHVVIVSLVSHLSSILFGDTMVP